MALTKVTTIVDERLNFIDPSNVSIGTHSSNENVSWLYQAPDGGNTGSIDKKTFTLQLPNGMVDSDLQVKYTFRISVNKSNTDLKNQFGFSCLAGNRIINTCTVKTDRLTMTTDIQDRIDLIASSLPKKILSLISPVYKQDYTHKYNTSASNDNVLQWGLDSNKDFPESRGFGDAFKYTRVSSYNANPAIYDVELTERILAAPFQYDQENPNPFFNVGVMTVVLDLFSDASSRMFKSGVDGTVVSMSDFHVYLKTRTYNPSLALKIPSTFYYNAPMVNVSEQQMTADVAAGSTGSITLNPIKLTGGPSLMAVWLPDSSSETSVTVPNRSLSVTQISLKVGNKDGLLGGITDQEIFYSISRKNGYNLSPSSFYGLLLNPADDPAAATKAVYGSGSMFLFKLDDIGVPLGFQSNSDIEIMVTPKVWYSNPTDADFVKPYVRFLHVHDNVVINRAGQWSEEMPLINPDGIASKGSVEFQNLNESNNVLGGAKSRVWNFIKNNHKKIGKFFGNMANKAKSFLAKSRTKIRDARRKLPLSKRAHKVFDAVGLGRKRSASSKRRVVRRQSTRGRGVLRSGGKLLRSGGKRASRSALRSTYMRSLGM